MALLTLLKLVGESFDVLAWPLITLGYPLYASIRAIESNSNADNRKLLTYWVLYALIILFEFTFAKFIEWFPFWPYMRLIATCWLSVPYFDATVYVYEHFVRPCLYVNPQTFCNWFITQKEDCLLRSSRDFLLVAERYIKENGSEELEKLISGKANCMEHSHFRTENNAVAATENIEAAAPKGVRFCVLIPESCDTTKHNKVNCTEPNLAQTENKTVAATENKTTASAGRGCELSRSPDSKKAEKEWTCAPSQVITHGEAVLKDPLQGKKHNLAQTENKTVAAMENKAMASAGRSCELSGSLDPKKSQKEWTCATCQVITLSESTWKDHLQGKKHKRALTENKTVTDMENKALAAKASAGRGSELSGPLDPKKAQNEWACALCQVITPSEAVLKDHLQGKKHKVKEEELIANKMTAKKNDVSISNPKNIDQPTVAPKKGVSTNEPNLKHVKKQEEKKVGVNGTGDQCPQKNLENTEIEKKQSPLWCEACDLQCNSTIMLNSHLSGKKHLARCREIIGGVLI